jgi:hypothetical protein
MFGEYVGNEPHLNLMVSITSIMTSIMDNSELNDICRQFLGVGLLKKKPEEEPKALDPNGTAVWEDWEWIKFDMVEKETMSHVN